jgi:YD repeat-containing protein
MNKLFTIFILLCAKNGIAQTFNYDNQSRLTSIAFNDGKRIEYTYDKVGNRISEKTISPICDTRISGYSTRGTDGIAYQWQVDTGNGFANLSDTSAFYYNINGDSLIIVNPPTHFAFNRYRCVVNTGSGLVFSDTYQFRIKATWYGNADSAWLNPANWECGVLPDQYTDVTVLNNRPHSPVIQTNTEVNSLKLESGTIFTVPTGVSLVIKSKKE